MFTKKSQLHNGFIEDNGGVNREAIARFSTEILAIGDLKDLGEKISTAILNMPIYPYHNLDHSIHIFTIFTAHIYLGQLKMSTRF